MNIETLFDSIQLPPEMRPCPQDDHKRWVCYREDETHKFGYQFDFSDTGLVSSGINIDDYYQHALHDAHSYLLYQGYSIHLVYTTEFDIMIEGFGYKRAMDAQGGISNQQDVSNFWVTQFAKHLSGSAQLPSSYPDFEVTKDALQQIMMLTAKTLKSRGSLQPATLPQLTLTMGMLTGTIDETAWRQMTDFQSDAQLMHALGMNIEKLFGFCLSSLSNAMSIQQAQSTVLSMIGSSNRSSLFLIKLIDESLILGLPVAKTAELIQTNIVPTIQPKLTISKERLSTWCEERLVIRGIPARGKGRATKAETDKHNKTYNDLKNKWLKNN